MSVANRVCFRQGNLEVLGINPIVEELDKQNLFFLLAHGEVK
jgi:hypothetical protein